METTWTIKCHAWVTKILIKWNNNLSNVPNPSSIIWYQLHRWDINRHTVRYTGPISVVSQCKNWCLAEGLRKRRSAVRLGKDFTFLNPASYTLTNNRCDSHRSLQNEEHRKLHMKSKSMCQNVNLKWINNYNVPYKYTTCEAYSREIHCNKLLHQKTGVNQLLYYIKHISGHSHGAKYVNIKLLIIELLYATSVQMLTTELPDMLKIK